MSIRLLFAAALFGLTACASAPEKVTVSPDTRVGLLLLVDEQPKHVHTGLLSGQSFERLAVSDWGLQLALQQYLDQRLGKPVTPLPATDALREQRLNMVTSGLRGIALRPNAARELETMAHNHGLELLVTLEPASSDPERDMVETSGYGVFTHCSFGRCRSLPLNYTVARIYAFNPLRVVASVTGLQDRDDLDLEIPRTERKMKAEEIDKARPVVLELLQETLDEALDQATRQKK